MGGTGRKISEFKVSLVPEQSGLYRKILSQNTNPLNPPFFFFFLSRNKLTRHSKLLKLTGFTRFLPKVVSAATIARERQRSHNWQRPTFHQLPPVLGLDFLVIQRHPVTHPSPMLCKPSKLMASLNWTLVESMFGLLLALYVCVSPGKVTKQPHIPYSIWIHNSHQRKKLGVICTFKNPPDYYSWRQPGRFGHWLQS